MSERAGNGTYRAAEILSKSQYGMDARYWNGYCTYVIRQDNRVVYVGMSTYGPRTRLRQHRMRGHSAIKQALSQPNTVVDVTYYTTRDAATKNERLLIEKLTPELNRR